MSAHRQQYTELNAPALLEAEGPSEARSILFLIVIAGLALLAGALIAGILTPFALRKSAPVVRAAVAVHDLEPLQINRGQLLQLRLEAFRAGREAAANDSGCTSPVTMAAPIALEYLP